MKSKISQMRRSICKILYRPTAIAAAAGDGGRVRATIAAAAGDGSGERDRGFLPTNANSRRPLTFMKVVEGAAKFGVFRSQLKNEERARRSVGVLFRAYGQYYGDKKKIGCETESEYEKRKWVGEVLRKVVEKVDAELGGDGSTTEIAQGLEEDDEYEKRFREIFQKLREKMNRVDEPFEFVTNLMIKCEPEYEKLVCDPEFDKCVRGVLQRIFIDDDEEREKVGNGRIRRITDLDIILKVVTLPKIEALLARFAIDLKLTNLMRFEKIKPLLMSYEVIEKVFNKKAGNENIFKIAEEEELLWELEDEVSGLVTYLEVK